MDGSLEALARDGFAWVRGAVEEPLVAALRQAFEALPEGTGVRRRGGGVFAVRNALGAVPETGAVLRAAPIHAAIEALLGPDARPVKATLFDKTATANWNVGWHQDVTIAVHERREAPGFGAWSVKAGVPHVQPPAAVLEGMLAARLHLDPCGADNGPLRVLPGSHRSGRLTAAEQARWVAECDPVLCTAEAGDLLLLRPLLLHASTPARAPGHRRVLHVEYAAAALPDGLEWVGVW